MEDLAKLKPSFIQMGEFGFNSVAIQKYPEVERMQHVHHAGNSSVIVDGASAVMVGTKEIGEELGLTPRAKIVGFSSTGTEPTKSRDAARALAECNREWGAHARYM